METLGKIYDYLVGMEWLGSIISIFGLGDWWAAFDLTKDIAGMVPEMIAAVICWYIIVYFIHEMSSKDIVFTRVKEGTAKLIMLGDAFFRVVFNWNGHFMQRPLRPWGFKRKVVDANGKIMRIPERDNQGNIVTVNGRPKLIKAKSVKLRTYEVVDSHLVDSLFFQFAIRPLMALGNMMLKVLGLHGIKFLGIPGLNSIHKRTFRWNSLRQYETEKTVNTEGGIYYEPQLVENMDYVLLQPDIYYARVEDAEDTNMIPLDLDTTLLIRITNPVLAVFGPQDWLEYVWGTYLPYVRVYTARLDWHKLNKERDKQAEDMGYSLFDIQQEIYNTSGASIQSFRFLRVSPAGDLKQKYENAATRPYFAQKDAEVVKISADAQALRYETEYKKLKELGGTGMRVRELEAIEKAASSLSPAALAFSIKKVLDLAKGGASEQNNQAT